MNTPQQPFPPLLRSEPRQQEPFSFYPLSHDVSYIEHKKWYASNGPRDTSLLYFNGSKINLWALHCEVINTPGGLDQVIKTARWPFIALALGLADIPATERTHIWARPKLAYRVQIVYQEFLFEFDHQLYMKEAQKHEARGRRAQEQATNQE